MKQSETVARLKVEALRGGEWQEVLGLHRVSRGEKFRVFAVDGISIWYQGTAADDGFINDKGIGCVPFDLNPGCVLNGEVIEEMIEEPA